MSEKPNPGLSQIFNHPSKKDLGKNRKVWEITGREGVDFIVKERQNSEELEILKFLSESGISEKLLTYDEKTLVLSKIDGIDIGDYLYDLVDKHPDKVVSIDAPPVQTDISRIKILKQETSHLPVESVLEEGEVRKFYINYISKVMTLVLCGILHRDIKVDNIMVTSSGEVKLIDFGHSVIVKEKESFKFNTNRAWAEINKYLEILQKINPDFHNHFPFRSAIEVWVSMFEELYSKYENISLQRRPKMILEWLDSKKLTTILQEMRFNEEFIPDIRENIISQLKILNNK